MQHLRHLRDAARLAPALPFGTAPGHHRGHPARQQLLHQVTQGEQAAGINAGHRQHVEHEPAQLGAGLVQHPPHFAAEELGIEEHQRRVEAEQQHAWLARPCGMSLQRVETAHAFYPPQLLHQRSRHRVNKAQQRQHHHQQNGLDRPDRHHAHRRQQAQRQLDPRDAVQLGEELQIDQRQRTEQQHHAERRHRHIGQRRGEEQQHQRNGQRRDHAGHLGATATAVGHRRARIGTADGKTLGKGGRHVGQAQGDELAIGIDAVAVLLGEALRRQHHAGEAHQGQTGGVGQQRRQHCQRKLRDMQLGQAGGNQPDGGHAARAQAE